MSADRDTLRRTSRGQRAANSGFSLLEALVALALVTVALLWGLSVAVLQPRLQEGARAGEEAMHAIEASLETLRVGEVPLQSGLLLPGIAYPAAGSDRNLRLTMEVDATEVPGLFEVEVEASYLTSGQPRRRAVKTLIWRPSS